MQALALYSWLTDVAQVAGIFPGDRIITINNRTIHKHSRGSILKLIAAAGSNVDIGVVYDPMRLDELNSSRASQGKPCQWLACAILAADCNGLFPSLPHHHTDQAWCSADLLACRAQP